MNKLRLHRETGEIAHLLPTTLWRPGDEEPPMPHWVCLYWNPHSGIAVRIVDDEVARVDTAWQPVGLSVLNAQALTSGSDGAPPAGDQTAV